MSKIVYLAVFFRALFFLPPWHVNMEEAQEIARKEHRHILLNFSGSDWCGPCILLRRDVFDASAFQALADSSLVLVDADFPRNKKDQLTKEQQQANDRLADKYNPKGKFPLTLLLSADGKVVKTWEGNPGWKPVEFAEMVREAIRADDNR